MVVTWSKVLKHPSNGVVRAADDHVVFFSVATNQNDDSILDDGQLMNLFFSHTHSTCLANGGSHHDMKMPAFLGLTTGATAL